MRVSINGGTPIAGWFIIKGKSHLKRDDDWGYFLRKCPFRSIHAAFGVRSHQFGPRAGPEAIDVVVGSKPKTSAKGNKAITGPLNHSKTIGKPWENHRKTMGKP